MGGLSIATPGPRDGDETNQNKHEHAYRKTLPFTAMWSYIMLARLFNGLICLTPTSSGSLTAMAGFAPPPLEWEKLVDMCSGPCKGDANMPMTGSCLGWISGWPPDDVADIEGGGCMLLIPEFGSDIDGGAEAEIGC